MPLTIFVIPSSERFAKCVMYIRFWIDFDFKSENVSCTFLIAHLNLFKTRVFSSFLVMRRVGTFIGIC